MTAAASGVNLAARPQRRSSLLCAPAENRRKMGAFSPHRHPSANCGDLAQDRALRAQKCCDDVGVGHVAGVGRCRHCARLYRASVPGRELRRPHARAGPRRLLAAPDLSAVARHLLHVVDVFRLGRACLAHRLRLPHHLYRADADGRPRLPAVDPHRAARQGPEHHLDRRLHCGALRQEPGGGGGGGADRHHRHDPVHRAAAQSGVVVGQHDPCRGLARRRGAAAAWRRRAVCRAGDGDIRRAVRHPPYRRHRASGRTDAGDRHRVDRQADGVSHRRRVRHLRHVPRPVRTVRARARRAAHRARC